MKSLFNYKTFPLLGVFAVLLATGCSQMQMGGADTEASGSAGGANAEGQNAGLERCDQSLGTMAVVEEANTDWSATLHQHKLGPTAPVLKLLAQQSNCFVIVERGAAMERMMEERKLMASGEGRKGSNFGRGQMVAADFTLSPSITFSNPDSGGLGVSLGGLLGRHSWWGGVLGSVALSAQFQEASTLLTLIDNRSGVQLAASHGSAKNTDFGALAGIFGHRGGGGIGGYGNTAEGKVIVAALTDSFNGIIRAVQNYQMQTVEGGLGTGKGGLGVQK